MPPVAKVAHVTNSSQSASTKRVDEVDIGGV